MEKKTKTIVVVGAAPSNGNRGCAALAVSLLSILSQISEENKLCFDVVFFDENVTCAKQTISFNSDKQVSYSQYEGTSLFKFFISMLRTKFKTLKIFFKADYFLQISGGDSFSDIYGIDRFKLFNNWNRFAKFFRKKCVFLPQTIGPFTDDKVKNSAKKSLEYASLVLTRDCISNKYVALNTKQKHVVNTIDMAFALPFKKKTFSENVINVGLNVSALLWNGGYTGKNQFGLALDYQKLIIQTINFFLPKDNVRVHLIAHDIALNETIGNDYAIAQKLSNDYDQLILAPFFLNTMEAKSYIAGMDFFIGSRMHATIAAYSTNVPVCPLSYSRKFLGLFQSSLNYPFCADLTTYSIEETLILIEKCFENRLEIKKDIDKSMNGFVKTQLDTTKKALSKILI